MSLDKVNLDENGNPTDDRMQAHPQESDKGRENGEDISLDDLPAYIATLERQLAEARAEVEALREEVALTNEHEHQIMQERNEARDELQTARDAYAELLEQTRLTEEAGGAVARAYQERDEALQWMIMRPAAKVRLGDFVCVYVYVCVYCEGETMTTENICYS